MSIKEYLYIHRLTQAQFAKDLGISYRYFNFVVHGQKSLPKRFWTKIILLTKGEVTIEDLIQLSELYAKYYKSPVEA